MRTLLGGELAQAQSFDSDIYVKLEVVNGSGTWIDVGGALGTHWIINATWHEELDTPVSAATFTLVQQIGSASLSPLMAASPLNVDDLGAYAPLLDIGRLVRAWTATMPHGVALDVSKYREIFTGRINRVEQADAPGAIMAIVLQCSDLGAWLQDTQIEVEGRRYGSDAGVPIGNVLQQIVDDNPDGSGIPVTLYDQSTNAFNVTELAVGRVKVLESLRDTALDSTGDDVRYRYDALHASRLTRFNPDRSRVTVDATFSANSYVLRQLDLDIENIRNAGKLPYIDATGAAQSVTASDAPSISKYRRRYFELASSPNIKTAPEATALLDIVINDLKAPPGEASAEVPYCWFVQLYDRYTFAANNRQFDAAQTFGVLGVRHVIESGIGTTTMTLTARIVGAYAEWLNRIVDVIPTDNEIHDLTRTDSADGDESTFSFTLGADVDSVWVSSLDITMPVQSSDWDLVAAAVAPLAPGILSYTVTRPIDGHEVLIQFEPRDANLNAGTVRRAEITATPQVPHWLWDDYEDYATGIGTLWGEYTERGIKLSAITFQTQVGSNPISGFVAPTRIAGAASVVRGGVLGPRQVEMDVVLDVDRQSWIVPHELLENGAERTPDGWFAFDRDKNPKLMGVTVSGTKITIIGDIDTKSIKVDDLNSTWEYTIDGPFAVIDVALTGTNGVAGLGASATSTYTVTAYSDRKAEVTGASLSDSRNVVVGGPSASAPLATIVDVVTVVPDVGNTNLTISIQVTSVIALWTIKLYIAESIDNPTIVPVSDFAASVVPSAVTPTATMVSHVYSATYTRVAGGPDTTSVYCNIRVDLCDGAGVVQDTKPINTGWETPA